MKNNDSGVLTLEACIVVPIFVAIMLVINGFFIMFMGQEIMVHTLIQTAESMSHDVYSIERLDETDNDMGVATMITDFLTYIDDQSGYVSSEKWYATKAKTEQVAEARFNAYLKEDETDKFLESLKISDLDFSGTNADMSTDILTLKLKYHQDFIFNALNMNGFDREMTIQIKMFRYKKVS